MTPLPKRSKIEQRRQQMPRNLPYFYETKSHNQLLACYGWSKSGKPVESMEEDDEYGEEEAEDPMSPG
jgi:hypothetical protein